MPTINTAIYFFRAHESYETLKIYIMIRLFCQIWQKVGVFYKEINFSRKSANNIKNESI